MEASLPNQPEALEVVEAARETQWQHPSFVGELFLGRFRHDLIFPFPTQPEHDKTEGDIFLTKLETFLRSSIDPEAIDTTGEIPQTVIDGLKTLGCFGMKISKEYGGLGFSQTNYNRAMALVSSHCTSTVVWLSAHQSIGVPQPLKMFGTPEQKKKYLPKLAAGAISAFALTEPGVGSDPAQMTTTAEPIENGDAFLLNGEKLWCTNGCVADYIVVVARTPSITEKGKERKQLTAFLVEKTMPGFEVTHRCDFMGLKGIQNAVLRFTNVRVPKENILWKPGAGLKLALITLNTGRLSLPASCLGGAKRCLEISRRWAKSRVQWGAPVGEHEAVAVRLARMTAATFAIDAVTWLVCGMVDRGGADIRLEAAMAKMFCTEKFWEVINDCMQVKGGRGYETARSLKARGEVPDPIERMMRDCRINLIFEGSSEIMRLFIAREALDAHLQIAGALFDPRAGFGAKLGAVGKMLKFYSVWYPKQWFYNPMKTVPGVSGKLQGHLSYAQRAAHKLARKLFHAMGRFGPKLEKRQMILWRAVDIGTELFAMTAVCARAAELADQGSLELAELWCAEARKRIQFTFQDFISKEDTTGRKIATKILQGDYAWLEEGAVHGWTGLAESLRAAI